MSDFDDLLGPDDDEAIQPVNRRQAKTLDLIPGVTPAVLKRAVFRFLDGTPLSHSDLATILRMDRTTVMKRLKDVEPIAYHRGNAGLYDFKQAIGYLVEARFDIKRHLERLGPGDLPLDLQKDYWDALNKKLKWEADAGELWRTEDVMEVLGDTAQSIKGATQLWTDNLADQHNLPNELRNDLRDLVDGLNKQIHEALIDMPEQKQTRPVKAEIEEK